MSAAGKALLPYGDTAVAQLARIVVRRDSALMQYMTSTHTLPAGAFRIQSADSAAFRTYNGPDRYTIGLEVEGESVEIAAGTEPSTIVSADGAGIPANASEKGDETADPAAE